MSKCSRPLVLVIIAVAGCFLLAGCGGASSAPVQTEASNGSSANSSGAVAGSDSSAQELTAKKSIAAAPIRDVSFDDIKFPMEKKDTFVRSMLTEKVEKLFGARIRIRGYILPSYQQSGITQFVLVRDNLECCFGPGAALFDCVLVDMEPGRSAEFTVRPIAVEGTFSFREIIGPNGKHLAIYHLSGEKVK